MTLKEIEERSRTRRTAVNLELVKAVFRFVERGISTNPRSVAIPSERSNVEASNRYAPAIDNSQ
jgi:hypothetical protein